MKLKSKGLFLALENVIKSFGKEAQKVLHLLTEKKKN